MVESLDRNPHNYIWSIWGSRGVSTQKDTWPIVVYLILPHNQPTLSQHLNLTIPQPRTKACISLFIVLIVLYTYVKIQASLSSSLRQMAKRNVWDFPRPPAINKVTKNLRVIHKGETIVDAPWAYEILETSHPPTYYISPEFIKMDRLKKNSRSTYCEWKGSASYYDLDDIKSRIWTYEKPNSRYKDLKDHLSFYVGPWDCYVDKEKVEAQPGYVPRSSIEILTLSDFYGGWLTSDIEGKVKGGPGTWGW